MCDGISIVFFVMFGWREILRKERKLMFWVVDFRSLS